MITLTFENGEVSEKKGVSAKSGKPYSIREQKCVVNGAGRFPQETRIALPDGVESYPAGMYEVTTPLNVGRFGFEVSRDLGLKLVKPQQKVA